MNDTPINQLLVLSSFFALILLFPMQSKAQSVGIGTTSPKSYALLDLNVPDPASNPQGLQMPTLTTAQRLAIPVSIGVDSGLVVYDKTLNDIFLFDGGAWRVLGGGSDNLGNHTMTTNLASDGFYYSNDGDNEGMFIGTSGQAGFGTNTPLSAFHVTNSSNQFAIIAGSDLTSDPYGLGVSSTDGGQVRITQEDGSFRQAMLFSDMSSGETHLNMFAIGSSFNSGVTYEPALTITQTRHVGINVLNATRTFEVAGLMHTDSLTVSTGSGNTGYVLSDDGSGLAEWTDPNTLGIGDDLGSHNMADTLVTNGNWISNDGDAEGLFVAADGRVGVGVVPTGTWTLEVNGTLGTSGINEMSDRRWKKDISSSPYGLQEVMKLNTVSYNWRHDLFPEKSFRKSREVGFIAQEVEKVLPLFVSTDAKGYKSVQYSKMVAVLTQAIQDQQTLIEAQQLQIDELRNLIDNSLKMNSEANSGLTSTSNQ